MDAELKAFNALLSADRKSNDELTELQRVAITAFVLAGRSYREAARAFGCSPGAVQTTVRRFRTARSFASTPRKGRPEKLSEEEKQAVARSAVAKNPPTYRELSGQLEGRVSLQTLKRVVKKARLAKEGE
ncbi:hypothetical protein CGRA01v4_00455 [Colletotrichum graminicola]|uniref:RNA polymerase sigma factor 70 region 4 type 2 domain-containing protein n=1 Tax=Colletotrichum graminicola (strain M1.001 / M2 / FGSC 10212) TaxID=645133 RepID=E3QHJ3_COLGM|nr:uncharacterized protein GLRG_05308 [Colletotrichum graminicola M1.001]EFQ30164.1 hypothetical protein GLRG_05308 [Colletotrichum graminicola M1.001]WDK09177.1 hypothetical protein CGRA01v4_00455 [Colletotrichum graminicola]